MRRCNVTNSPPRDFQYLDVVLLVHLRRSIINSFEGSSCNGLLLCALNFRLSSVQYLQEASHSVSHSGVEIRFRAFQMILEVITEGVDVINRLLSLSRSNVWLE